MYDSTKPYKKKILKLIRQTWETPYISVKEGFVRKKFSYVEYHHTDGTGTKGVYHWQHKSFRNAVIDALAMNLNDLALMRATPYAIIDHLFLPEDDEKAILEIIKYLTDECKKRKIAITGGETAIHNNMGGLELSISMLGFIISPKPNQLEVCDTLIGIESNGLHSNGFTKVREVFREEYLPDFIAPTNIYSDIVLYLTKRFNIHGMMHITGGAYTKLRDLLVNEDVEITRRHQLKPQNIFRKLYEKGIPDEEMYKIFNCGVGFVLSVPPRSQEEVLPEINSKGFKADVIGKVTRGNGKIKIESMFSDKMIEL